MKKVILSIMILLGVYSTNAHAVTITVGRPARAGRVDLRVGKAPEVDIFIIVPAGTTAEGKAELLTRTIKNFTTFSARRNGNEVRTSAQKVEIFRDTTIETTRIAARENAFGVEAIVGYEETINGSDQDGFDSVFEASLGFDGITADASVIASDLSTPTIDNLLTEMFNKLSSALPGSLQSNLSLDLIDDRIKFLYPDNASDAFVQNFTSDINTEPTLSFEETPVPEPLTILGSGVALGFGALFKRELAKRQKKEKAKA